MRGDLLYRSFNTRKKFLYITLSVLISIVLLIMDAYDLAMLMSVQRPNPFIHQAATTIMVCTTYQLTFLLSPDCADTAYTIIRHGSVGVRALSGSWFQQPGQAGLGSRR